MKKCIVSLVVSAVVTIVGSVSDSCQAGTLTPKSYDLPNGQLGGDVPNFFDDTYTGTGNKHAVLAPLTGGLGDLTDGVIATTNWNGQYLRYVGWDSIDPKISFHVETYGSILTTRNLAVLIIRPESQFPMEQLRYLLQCLILLVARRSYLISIHTVCQARISM